MKVKTKFLLFSFIFTILFATFSLFYYQNTKQELLEQKYDQIVFDVKYKFKTLIKEKSEAISLIALSLSISDHIKTSLIEKNAQALNLQEYTQLLAKETSLHNIWFQVITADGKSFYRSWTKNRGDNLLTFRVDVKKMIKEHKIISAISTGKFDMTFKSMVPIFYDGEFIGVVEAIGRFESLVNKMKSEGIETLVVIDKSYRNQLTKSITKNFINDYYVSNKLACPQLLELFRDDSAKLIGIKNYIVDKTRGLLLSRYILSDIHGNNMGYFIFAKELSKIDFSMIEQKLNRLLIVLAVVLLTILGFVFYIYSVQYKNFIQGQNEALEENVKLKTKELYHTAHHDALTGLPNRVLFLDRIEEMIKYAHRHKSNVFVLFLDLDRFKEINDTYGHHTGDELLTSVASRLLQNVRFEDTIARIGGDEFTILLRDIESKDVLVVITKIIESMKKSFYISGVEFHTTFSIGVASYPDDGNSAEVLLRNADTAMYKAKDLGKNRYQFYNAEMTKRAQERIEMEADIRKALENKEFIPYFQPKIDARDGHVIGMEALVRWNHPQKGLIFPDAFLPLAAEVGLLSSIDAYMREMSMKVALEFLDKGLDFGKLALNVSIVKLDNIDFYYELKNSIENLGFDPKRVEIEILESQSANNQEHVITVLNKIKSLGINISIDDFGTGYSSLSYLKKLPIDTLKIDRSFVSGLPEEEDSVSIVQTILDLAQNLKMNVIAEGVETQEQKDFLLEKGCYAIQGYFYSKPISIEAFEEFLVDNTANHNSIV